MLGGCCAQAFGPVAQVMALSAKPRNKRAMFGTDSPPANPRDHNIEQPQP